MKKIITLIVLVLISICVFAKNKSEFSIREHQYLDELIEESVDFLYISFQEIPLSKTKDRDGKDIEGVGILPFKDDIDDKFHKQLKRMMTKTKFNVYEKQIGTLLEEQAIQQQDFYSKDGRVKIGLLTQWKGMIYGQANTYMENFLGKRKIYLEINLTFNNLETGQMIWSEPFTKYKKINYSIHYFIYGVIFILLAVFSINIFSKGRYTSKIIGTGFFLILLYTIWFFVL